MKKAQTAASAQNQKKESTTSSRSGELDKREQTKMEAAQKKTRGELGELKKRMGREERAPSQKGTFDSEPAFSQNKSLNK